MEVVRPSDGASVLAVTEQAQEFYLEYAQYHLNDIDNVTITRAKFGECSSVIPPINLVGGGGGGGWGGGGYKFLKVSIASHLRNCPEMLDFQSENLGKSTIISLPLRHGFHGRRRLKESIASLQFRPRSFWVYNMYFVFVTNTFVFHFILSFHSS